MYYIPIRNLAPWATQNESLAWSVICLGIFQRNNAAAQHGVYCFLVWVLEQENHDALEDLGSKDGHLPYKFIFLQYPTNVSLKDNCDTTEWKLGSCPPPHMPELNKMANARVHGNIFKQHYCHLKRPMSKLSFHSK